MNRQNTKLFLSSFIFIFGALITLLYTIGMACMPPEQTVVIEARADKNLLAQEKSCLDQNCLFVLEKNEYGYFSLKRMDTEINNYPAQDIGSVDEKGETIRITYFSFDRNDEIPLDKTAFVEALDKLIENDIADIKPILFQEIESWMSSRKEYFLSGNLTFTPYDQSKEAKLLKNKNQLLDCHYADYKRVGNWLIKNDTSRDYCYLSGGGGGMCPSVVISYPKFFAFLFTNINSAAVPYLFIFFALIAGVMAFTVYLIRKKELWFFLKPTKPKVILTIIAAVVLSSGLLTILRGIDLWYLLFVYLITGLIEYIKLKRKSEPKID